jgi:alpha-ketoglutarate-dependent sulfate ester dioxygenase
VGLTTVDTADLYQLFQRHVTDWKTLCGGRGAMVTWTSGTTATQHYAVADYDDSPRLMHRVIVADPVPIGIGGDTSIARKGDASFYSSLTI